MSSLPNLHQRKSERMRESLLDAAVALLHDRRDGSLSLQEVARAAGVTVGAVQHHFSSKSMLRLHVMERLIGQSGEAAVLWPDPQWPLQRRAAHFVRQAWETVFGHPRFCASWAAYLAACPDDDARAGIARQRDVVFALMCQRILAAFPELAARPDAATCVEFILATFRGMGLVVPFAPADAFAAQLALLEAVVVRMCTPDAAPPSPTPSPTPSRSTQKGNPL